MAIFSVYLIDNRRSFACTNMARLSDESGLGYSFLVYHFTRDKKIFYMDSSVIIIKSATLIKGLQDTPDGNKFNKL